VSDHDRAKRRRDDDATSLALDGGARGHCTLASMKNERISEAIDRAFAERRLRKAKVPPTLTEAVGYICREEDDERTKLFDRIPERPIAAAQVNAAMKIVERLADTNVAAPLQRRNGRTTLAGGFHPQATRQEVRRSFEADGFDVQDVDG
jgi:hypothetical protein